MGQGGGVEEDVCHHGMVLREEASGMFYFLTLVIITWVFILQLFVKQYICVLCICLYMCYILQ